MIKMIKRHEDDALILKSTEDLLREKECSLLKEDIREQLKKEQQNFSRIEIDLKNASKIDSCGLSLLIMLEKLAQEQGLSLNIKNVESEYIKNIFRMTNLDKVLKINYSN